MPGDHAGDVWRPGCPRIEAGVPVNELTRGGAGGRGAAPPGSVFRTETRCLCFAETQGLCSPETQGLCSPETHGLCSPETHGLCAGQTRQKN